MKTCRRTLACLVVTFLCGVASRGALAADYTIHAGDQLNVQVYGDQSLTQTVTVLPDGTITYPLIGRVPVSGKTTAGAADAIKHALLKYVRQPFVTVVVAQEGQPNVLVLGDVKTPGKYQLRSGARVTDAIAAAGGLSDDINGTLPVARVSDGDGGTIQSIPLQALLHDGNASLDKQLGEGSVVYVPGPLQYDIEVTGAVDRPGEVRLNEGDRLSMAIAKAGNSANSNADLNNIRITRTATDGTKTTYKIDLYKALEDGESQYDIQLQKDDVVYVPQARKPNPNGLTGLLYLLGHFI